MYGLSVSDMPFTLRRIEFRFLLDESIFQDGESRENSRIQPLERRLLGSVSDSVVGKAHCTVEVVRR